jgi:hypothetical protein
MPRIPRIVLTALAAVAAIYAVVSVWRHNETAAGLDFYIYYVAAQLPERADVDNIYSDEVQGRVGEEYFERAQRSGSELRKYDARRRRRLDLVSSPFLYSTLRWVSRDYDRALLQYRALLLACFVAGVLLLCRTAGLPWWWACLLLTGLLFWYRGFEADLRVGNVNSIQLLAVAVAVRFARVRWVVFGLLIAFKPNLLFVPLLFLIAERARWRMNVLQGAIGGLVAFAVASISFGTPRVWLQWVNAANAFYHRLPTRVERNVTPALDLFREHGEWISYAFAAVLLTVVIVRSRKVGSFPQGLAPHPDPLPASGERGLGLRLQGHELDPALLAGLGILVYLLTANVVWLHYMVLVLPVAIALMRRRATAVVAVAALLLIAEEPYEWLVRRAAFDVEVWLIAPAMAALFVCAVWKLSQRDEAAPAR